jgi:hypothetical protein
VNLVPRQVEPGAVWRWSAQAWQLIMRGFGMWFGLATLLSLWMFFGRRLPLLDGMLALTTFFASILVAACLDRGEFVTVSEVLRSLRLEARAILGFSAAIACVGAIIWMLLLARPGVAWWNAFYTERNAVKVLSADWYVATRQIYVYSAYALGLSYFGLNLPGLTSFFQFPCMTLLGLPVRTAYSLGAAGQLSNLPAMLAVGLMFILLPVILVLLLPPIVPLLYCFLGALCYVSFRDIFLGVSENRRREAVRELGIISR